MIVTIAQAVSAYAQNSQIAPLDVRDSITNVMADLGSLETLAQAGVLGSLTFADDNYIDQQQPTVTASQLVADAGVFDNLLGCNSIPISGTLTAGQAAGLGLDHATAIAIKFGIADTAANIAANLDALQSMAAAGRLASIAVTDGGTLDLTAAQADADANALALIAKPQIAVSNAATGTLALAAGSAFPGALAAGTDIILEGSGSWQISGPVPAGAAFEFADPAGGLSVLETNGATFDSASHLSTPVGHGGELIACGTTSFAGNLWAGGQFTIDIENGSGAATVPGQFDNLGTIVTSTFSTITGAASATLANSGTIVAAMCTLTVSTALDNHGLIEIQDGGCLLLDGAATNEAGGQIILQGYYQNQFARLEFAGALTNNGQVVDSSGIVAINGALSGNGSIVIGDGAHAFQGGTVEVDLGGSVAAGQHVAFAAGQGLLKLEDAAAFHGTVDNFNFKDLIDLAGVQADSTEYDATTGTLTVLSGSTEVCQFTLTGGSQLNTIADGQGGTLLTLETPGTPAQVVQVMTQGTVAGDPMLPNWSAATGQQSSIPFLAGAGWSFTATGTPVVSYSIGANVSAAQSQAIVNALDLWSSVCNIQFQQAPAGTVGRIDFEISTAGLSDTVPRFDSAGNCIGNTVYLNTSAACWADIVDLAATDGTWGNAGFTAILHEIGHAIGLDHPAAYTETCWASITEQLFYTDSEQYSVMSYYPSSYTGANIMLPAGVNISPQTPMMYDILAVQSIYGANTQTLAGNETFGFHSTFGANSANPIREYDFTQNSEPFVTLCAGGSNNTLDLSGFVQNATVNLQPGSFSSVGGYSGNLGIAYGTKIDHAIGGSGDDTFVVNGDNDVIDGGGGTNTVVFSGARAQYNVVSNGSTVTVSANGITDTLTNVQILQFADTTQMTAAGATAAVQPNAAAQPVSVSDCLANVFSNLDALQGLAAAGKLAAISVTDLSGPAQIAVTAQQATNDAAVLKQLFCQDHLTATVPLQFSAADTVALPSLTYGEQASVSGPSTLAMETPCVALNSEYVSLSSYGANLTATIGSGVSTVTIYDGAPAGGHASSGFATVATDTGSTASYCVETAGATLHLSAASTVTVELNNAYYGESDLSITGWVGGSDHLSLAEPGWQGLTKASLVVAGSTPIQALDTAAAQTATVIQLGTVGAGDAASVAAAAAAAYHPSTTGTDAFGVYFCGTTTAGNTTVYAFLGDTHGTVTAADLVHAVTLVGIATLGAESVSVG